MRTCPCGATGDGPCHPSHRHMRWFYFKARMSIRINRLRFRDPRRCPIDGSYLPHITMWGTRNDPRNHSWRQASEYVKEVTR